MPWSMLVPLYKVEIELVFFLKIIKKQLKDYNSKLLGMFLKDSVLQ